MDSVELIYHYFPDLTALQQDRFRELKSLYEYWNKQINVISRKDFDFFYERHVLHSLAIAKVITFNKNTNILDVGTGGGFPGIPLAVLFPDVSFHLIDSIGKKIKVVNEVAKELKLENTRTTHERAENIREKYDFIVSRAVTAMPIFLSWIDNKFTNQQKNALSNGVLYLKGGDLTEEMKTIKQPTSIYLIHDYFNENFFETKKVVYLPMTK